MEKCTQEERGFLKEVLKGDSFKYNGEKFIIFKDFPLMYNPLNFQPYFKLKIFKNLRFETINFSIEPKEYFSIDSIFDSIENIKSTRILLIELNYNKKC
jgi:hypothetical protein